MVAWDALLHAASSTTSNRGEIWIRRMMVSPQVQCIRGGTYYCVGLDTLVDLMCAAGYVQVEVVRERFFQPLLIGTKPSPDEA
jgi:hypothetical protein